jgi:hypothetical protein
VLVMVAPREGLARVVAAAQFQAQHLVYLCVQRRGRVGHEVADGRYPIRVAVRFIR